MSVEWYIPRLARRRVCCYFTANPPRAYYKKLTIPRLSRHGELWSSCNGSDAHESSTAYAGRNSLCQTHRTLTHNVLVDCRERPRTSLHPTSQNLPWDIPTPPTHSMEHSAVKADRHTAPQRVLRSIDKRTPNRICPPRSCLDVSATARAIRWHCRSVLVGDAVYFSWTWFRPLSLLWPNYIKKSACWGVFNLDEFCPLVFAVASIIVFDTQLSFGIYSRLSGKCLYNQTAASWRKLIPTLPKWEYGTQLS